MAMMAFGAAPADVPISIDTLQLQCFVILQFWIFPPVPQRYGVPVGINSLSGEWKRIQSRVAGMNSKAPIPRFPMKDRFIYRCEFALGDMVLCRPLVEDHVTHRSGNESAKNGGRP